MKPLLVVLNPRHIDACIDAFRALDIDKAWMTGYTERELVEPMADLIERTDYTHYVACSDDVIPTQDAVNDVVELATMAPVATGWCNLDGVETRVNLCKTPLLGDTPSLGSYDFYNWMDVLGYPTPIVPTSFTGMSLTAMSRELWQRFPFDCFGDVGAASDFHLSQRLHRAGIPIVAAKRGFVYHVKDNWPSADIVDPKKALIHLATCNQRVTLEERKAPVPTDAELVAEAEAAMMAAAEVDPAVAAEHARRLALAADAGWGD